MNKHEFKHSRFALILALISILTLFVDGKKSIAQENFPPCKAINTVTGRLSDEQLSKITDMVISSTDSNSVKVQPATGWGSSFILDCGNPITIDQVNVWFDKSSPRDSWPAAWTLFGLDSPNSTVGGNVVARINRLTDSISASTSAIGAYASYFAYNTPYRYFRFQIDATISPDSPYATFQDISLTPDPGCIAIGKSTNGSSPTYEDFRFATDGNNQTKYLNVIAEGEGNALYLDCKSEITLSTVRFIMANDEPKRDPKKIRVFGSTSNPLQEKVNWELVGESMTEIRCSSMLVSTAYCRRYEETIMVSISQNKISHWASIDKSFRYFQIRVEQVRGPSADSVQFAEIKLSARPDSPRSAQTTDTSKSQGTNVESPKEGPLTTEKRATGSTSINVLGNSKNKTTKNKSNNKQTSASKIEIDSKKKSVSTISIKCLKGKIVRQFTAQSCPAGWIKSR